MTLAETMERMQELARPDQLAGMARYGINTTRRLGLAVPDMRRLAKEIGRDHELALELWAAGLAEARIVAAMVADPERLTAAQMDAWAGDLDSWDVCDQVCQNLFERSPLAWEKIHRWSEDDREFVRRAAYALVACLAWHDKEAEDARFVALLPLMVRGAVDSRNMVKKAVSWALRNLGKRNPALREAVLRTAEDLRSVDSPPARWIAADVTRDLGSAATARRMADPKKWLPKALRTRPGR